MHIRPEVRIQHWFGLSRSLTKHREPLNAHAKPHQRAGPGPAACRCGRARARGGTGPAARWDPQACTGTRRRWPSRCARKSPGTPSCAGPSALRLQWRALCSLLLTHFAETELMLARTVATAQFFPQHTQPKALQEARRALPLPAAQPSYRVKHRVSSGTPSPRPCRKRGAPCHSQPRSPLAGSNTGSAVGAPSPRPCRKRGAPCHSQPPQKTTRSAGRCRPSASCTPASSISAAVPSRCRARPPRALLKKPSCAWPATALLHAKDTYRARTQGLGEPCVSGRFPDAFGPISSGHRRMQHPRRVGPLGL